MLPFGTSGFSIETRRNPKLSNTTLDASSHHQSVPRFIYKKGTCNAWECCCTDEDGDLFTSQKTEALNQLVSMTRRPRSIFLWRHDLQCSLHKVSYSLLATRQILECEKGHGLIAAEIELAIRTKTQLTQLTIPH